MPKPRRNILAVLEETSSPPAELPENQFIAKVIEAKGKNLYEVELAKAHDKQRLLVELPSKFRSTVWIKMGNYVVVDRSTLADRDNKLAGEIVNVVREEKQWRPQKYWPEDFVKSSTLAYGDDSDDDDDDDLAGKMPPSDSEDEA